MPLEDEFCDILKKARTGQGLSVGDVSRMVGLPSADISGLAAHMQPFLGNIGTTPSRDLPDSHNAGDFGSFLVDAPHKYAMSQDELIL